MALRQLNSLSQAQQIQTCPSAPLPCLGVRPLQECRILKHLAPI